MNPGSKGLGLKKGAWTSDEDMLLKNCIEKYGEGKWHLIPLKSGLNRCRKSCRLRWLNYLRPNIKRGDFKEDEVDLMLRLHKLLGNRWSLIAGRIPGRTANDVKNYFNTHIQPRSKQQKKEANNNESLEDTTITIIKPQRHTISKTLNLHMGDIVSESCGNLVRSSTDGVDASSGLSLSPIVLDDTNNKYLEELFDDHEMEFEGYAGWSFHHSPGKGEALNVVQQQDDNIDFPIDEVMWNLTDSDYNLGTSFYSSSCNKLNK